MPATFKKVERLCSLKEIKTLITKGNILFQYPFKVIYISKGNSNEQPRPNATIVSVPKKNFKRAVKRNLLKRRIRESYRLNKELLKGLEGESINIMFIYTAKEVLPYEVIEKKLKIVLQKVTETINENREEN